MPQLAAALIDAFLPTTNVKQPMLFFPIPTVNDSIGLKNSRIMTIPESLETFARQDQFHAVHSRGVVDEFGKQALQAFRIAAQNSLLFFGKSIEDIQRFFTQESQSTTYPQHQRPVGVVTYYPNHPTKTGQDSESISDEQVTNIVHEALGHITNIPTRLSPPAVNAATPWSHSLIFPNDIHNDENIPTFIAAPDVNAATPWSDGLARRLEMLFEDPSNEILVERIVEDSDGSVRMFTISDDFLARIDSIIDEDEVGKAQEVSFMHNLGHVLKLYIGQIASMKIQALVSAKETVAGLLDYGDYGQDNHDEEEEKEPRWMLGSSSWPWNTINWEMLPESCLCLYPAQLTKIAGAVVTDQQPCTQPIPWCFVGSLASCPDMAELHQDFTLSGLQLWWSQKACTKFKQSQPVGGPNYF
jgi:hypothetical protein